MAISSRIKIEEVLTWPNQGADGNEACPIELIAVTNNAAAALTAGMVVILKKATCTADLLSVNTTTSTDDLEVCGMAYEAIAVSAVGRMQIFGPTTALHADGTTDVALGSHLGTITPAGCAATSATAHARFATATEAYTTNDALGVIDAMILCRNMRGW